MTSIPGDIPHLISSGFLTSPSYHYSCILLIFPSTTESSTATILFFSLNNPSQYSPYLLFTASFLTKTYTLVLKAPLFCYLPAHYSAPWSICSPLSCVTNKYIPMGKVLSPPPSSFLVVSLWPTENIVIHIIAPYVSGWTVMLPTQINGI